MPAVEQGRGRGGTWIAGCTWWVGSGRGVVAVAPSLPTWEGRFLEYAAGCAGMTISAPVSWVAGMTRRWSGIAEVGVWDDRGAVESTVETVGMCG